MEGSSLVSIVVPTKNSGRTLRRCLESMRCQTYQHLEVIVVDAQSDDGTESIASELSDLVLKLSAERSEARNYGAGKSRGSYLFFVDSDMYLASGLVEECVHAADREGESAVIVPEVSAGEGFWARCRALEKECYRGDDAIEAARFFPRLFFFSLGGFDTTLGPAGEDWDLTMRARTAGRKVLRVETPLVHDDASLTLRDAVRKKYYYGKHIIQFVQRRGWGARKQVLPWRAAYVRNAGRLARNPFLTLGLATLKAFEFSAAATGMAVSHLRHYELLRGSRTPEE